MHAFVTHPFFYFISFYFTIALPQFYIARVYVFFFLIWCALRMQFEKKKNFFLVRFKKKSGNSTLLRMHIRRHKMYFCSSISIEFNFNLNFQLEFFSFFFIFICSTGDIRSHLYLHCRCVRLCVCVWVFVCLCIAFNIRNSLLNFFLSSLFLFHFDSANVHDNVQWIKNGLVDVMFNWIWHQNKENWKNRENREIVNNNNKNKTTLSKQHTFYVYVCCYVWFTDLTQ